MRREVDRLQIHTNISKRVVKGVTILCNHHVCLDG